MKVFTSVVIDAPIREVWAAVRSFDGVENWNPAVSSAVMESGTATSIGSVRSLGIVDGTTFRETLLAHSDIEFFYTYDIIESPLPCTNYISTHSFIPITDGDKTLGIWKGKFECAADQEDSLREIVGSNIYRDGMRGLNEYLNN
ncbi:MAG: SRPBCC family protein [Pseudomonadota bacterium]